MTQEHRPAEAGAEAGHNTRERIMDKVDLLRDAATIDGRTAAIFQSDTPPDASPQLEAAAFANDAAIDAMAARRQATYAPGSEIPDELLDALYTWPPGYLPNWHQAFRQSRAEVKRLRAQVAELDGGEPIADLIAEIVDAYGGGDAFVRIEQDAEWTVYVGGEYIHGLTFGMVAAKARQRVQQHLDWKAREVARAEEAKAALVAGDKFAEAVQS